MTREGYLDFTVTGNDPFDELAGIGMVEPSVRFLTVGVLKESSLEMRVVLWSDYQE
jgi:hypothetical protein